MPKPQRPFSVTRRADSKTFQFHGLVDDATVQSIGRFIGVQSIVTSTFEPIGAFFHY